MIRLLEKLDKTKPYYLGLSGGADSMGAYHFLKQMKYKVDPLFFNHCTEACSQAEKFLGFRSAKIAGTKPAKMSKEEWWREDRYKFFHKMDREVIVAHHLDDVVETWVWSSLHGQSKLIPYRNGNVIRPFLATPKSELVNWCKRHRVKWIEDFTNLDINHQRNYIRHTMMPHILKINPGIGSMLRKKLLARSIDKIRDL